MFGKNHIDIHCLFIYMHLDDCQKSQSLKPFNTYYLNSMETIKKCLQILRNRRHTKYAEIGTNMKAFKRKTTIETVIFVQSSS